MEIGVPGEKISKLPSLSYPSTIQVYRALMPEEGFDMFVGQNGTPEKDSFICPVALVRDPAQERSGSAQIACRGLGVQQIAPICNTN